MARGTMHAPKPNAARRNAPAHGEASVTDDGQLRGPDLAEELGREDLSPATLKWYDTWRRSPQAQLFEATDWSRLVMLAPIVDYYFKANKPSAQALSEIRMNEERLGATYVDRMRARIRVEKSEKPDAEVVELHAVGRPSLADRMKR
jgi:hypothetical protein